ncbi:ABC transporter permease [Companilactobacillus paralimentarius]|uniref:ABC transporter permease n=1 Tax=Companilactobacillus paralimentarius TaxID=83526 RepID=UPI00384ECFC4
MNKFIFQTKINFKRIVLRNKAFFFFDMLLPIVFYILYTKILVSNVPVSYLKVWNKDYLVSMMIYACMLGGIITTANTFLEDQMSNFKLFVTLSPLSNFQYYGSMSIVLITLNLVSSIALTTVAIIVNHVSISIGLLFELISINLLGTILLILIGVLISFARKPNTVNLLTNLVIFPLAILSGLWWPINIMPTWLQNIGKVMPTYQLSVIDKNILHQTTQHIGPFINLLIWSFIIFLILFTVNKIQKEKGLVTQ